MYNVNNNAEKLHDKLIKRSSRAQRQSKFNAKLSVAIQQTNLSVIRRSANLIKKRGYYFKTLKTESSKWCMLIDEYLLEKYRNNSTSYKKKRLPFLRKICRQKAM